MRLRSWVVQARLREPMSSAYGEVRERPLVHVQLSDDDRLVGSGEAAPLPSYDGVGIDDVQAALADCEPVLARAAAGTPRAEILAACAHAAVLPQAVAAIDLSLWDLEGRRAGQPVWRLLGAEEAPSVEVNAMVAAPDRAGAAMAAGAARAAGFRCVKVKVGLGDDFGRIYAVRAVAGPAMAIRLDANGAWTVEEAVNALRVMAPADIECCEEPCSGLEATRAVAAATSVPVALDESARLPGALGARVCTAVCLKISACGGISGLLAAAERARGAGYQVYLASTLDGPLGIAAALHAAAVVRPERPCGLATLDRFDARVDPLPPIAGCMAAPAGPGLGPGLERWYK